MILDELKNAKLYAAASPGLAKAFKFLAAADLNALPNGRHEIEGDSLYASVMTYDTKPLDKAVWEAHRRYMDVQYIITGQERMGYAPLGALTPRGDYNSEKDCILLDGAGSHFTVTQGMFAVFGPLDAHMPGVALAAPAPVKKIVVKVKV